MKKNKDVVLIKSDKTIIKIKPKNNKYFTLEELQKYVGGLIDIVYLPNSDYIFVVNDEGMFEGKFNSLASLICTTYYMKECILFGDVVYCPSKLVP